MAPDDILITPALFPWRHGYPSERKRVLHQVKLDAVIEAAAKASVGIAGEDGERVT